MVRAVKDWTLLWVRWRGGLLKDVKQESNRINPCHCDEKRPQRARTEAENPVRDH
jgi:hypothetical protein